MHVSTLKRFARLSAIAMMVVLAFSLPAIAKNDKQAQSMMPGATGPASQYVGADTCKTCHEDIVNNFQANPHWNSTLKVNGTEVHACETCHGPGQAHVESGGDKSKIFVFEGQRADVISGRCLTCHAASHPQGNFMRSQHFKNGISCIECHSPHHAREKNALLLQDQPTLCYRCHTDVRAAFSMPFRHRVNEKLIQCTDCHNPHGSYLPKRALRTTASQEMVCFNCHRDKQGPFLYEHLAVKGEGCTACHTPHGSTNPRLLRVFPVNILCMQCHTQVFISPTQQVNGIPAIPTFHNQAQKYQACTLCHTNIHGSNASEFFFY
jgi:DmsE family decaheme c-type cytochrome